MNKKEDYLIKVNEARTAGLALQSLSPVLEELEERALARLKCAYRENKFSETLLVSIISEMCAFDDLKIRLHAIIQQGDSAYKKLENEKEKDFVNGRE